MTAPHHGKCFECVVIHRGHRDHLPYCFWSMVNESLYAAQRMTEGSLKEYVECREGCGGCCSCHCGDDDDDEDDDDDQLVEYACPHCGNEVTFEIDGFDFEEENLCPACGKPLFPDDEEEE